MQNIVILLITLKNIRVIKYIIDQKSIEFRIFRLAILKVEGFDQILPIARSFSVFASRSLTAARGASFGVLTKVASDRASRSGIEASPPARSA